MAVDFGKGYLRLRRPATVQLEVPQTRSAPGKTFYVDYVAARRTTYDDKVKFDPMLSAGSMVFIFFKEMLPPTIYPEKDYVVRHNGRAYVIKEVEIDPSWNRWKCYCTENNLG